MAKLEPPPKNRLGSVNKRPDLVEKRRRELESWLWKLIGDGEIARSQVLNKFLELSDAARLVQRYTVTLCGFALSSLCLATHTQRRLALQCHCATRAVRIVLAFCCMVRCTHFGFGHIGKND